MIKPMLAKLTDKPFDDNRYIWETKYDGIRCIAKTEATGYQLWSRSGSDKTKLFPDLELRTKVPAILDGELVCQSDGFSGIQHRANRKNNVAWASIQYPATYFVFDCLGVAGKILAPFGQDIDCICLSLMKRKQILESILIETHNVKIAPYTENGIALYEQIKLAHGEGVIGKLKTGTYQQGKREWLKVKVPQIGEFVICGYTQGTGWRSSTFGALVLGKFDEPPYLTYVGNVGTGFDEAEIARLFRELTSLNETVCPFAREPEKATWVEPTIRVMVKYLEYTNDGKLRFPSYKGII